MTTFLNRVGLSRNIRNNNPGNLVMTSIPWQGKIPNGVNTDGHFEQFVSIKWGLRALYRDIITDYEKGLTTVTKLIHEFAPEFENNTSGYISAVAKQLGVSSVLPFALTKDRLIQLAKAIVYVESRPEDRNILTDADYEEAFSILGRDLPSKKKLD